MTKYEKRDIAVYKKRQAVVMTFIKNKRKIKNCSCIYLESCGYGLQNNVVVLPKNKPCVPFSLLL